MTVAGLAAAVIAGVAARAWRLGLPGLSSDEAFSWRLTRYGLGEMVRRAAEDVHPPLYGLVLKAWLATWGDAPEALRGLSVVLGVAMIPLAVLLVREAAVLDPPPLAARLRAGAWLAGVVVALHATQVLQSRNARMYALGMALAVASACLLLRARRAVRRRWAWWAAWGLAAAAAVGTHYYLLFTVAAQAGWALVPRRGERTPIREALFAGAVALLVFAPWAAVFWQQTRRVQAAYSLGPPTASSLAQAVARWASGVEVTGAAPLLAALTLLSLMAALRAGRAGRFLAVQALAPWALGLGVSVVTGRPLVLERYMVFAQAFLLCAWVVAVAAVDRAPLRAAAAAALVVAVGWGLLAAVRAYPEEPPAMAAAARFLKRQARGDLVVVDSPRALNKLRYYARQVDAEDLDVRCALPERKPLPRYVSHEISLAPGDDVPADGVFASGATTVWRGHESTAPPDPAPAGWMITYVRMLEGGEDTRFALVRYQRAAVP